MSYSSNTVFEVRRLTYSQFYRLSRISSDGFFDIDSSTSVPSSIEFLNIIVMKSNREQMRIVKNGILSTSDSKVAVNHVSDLSSSKKPILFLSISVPRD